MYHAPTSSWAVVNPGLGDMDAVIARHGCGIVCTDPSVAAHELLRLIDTPDVTDRCRSAAEASFDLESGVERLLETYREITKAPTTGSSRPATNRTH
jgi:hypothetical protein